MMLHSIIIPHRNRNQVLRWCLWSITQSGRSALGDYEVVVVDAGSTELPIVEPPARVVPALPQRRIFNKPLCLNKGIEEAKGKILTFLDADMLVGPLWLNRIAVYFQDDPSIIRLCHRVRRLRTTNVQTANQTHITTMLDECPEPRDTLSVWFDVYDCFPLAYEAYGVPERGNGVSPSEPVFGNSQFSIQRDTLGNLRYDTRMEGAGYEDLWMARLLWDKFGVDYKGVMVQEPRASLLHMDHPRYVDPNGDWCTPESNKRNRALYLDRWPDSRPYLEGRTR